MKQVREIVMPDMQKLHSAIMNGDAKAVSPARFAGPGELSDGH